MRQENRDKLEQFRGHYNLFKDVQVVKHIDMADRHEIQRIIREEFDPQYFTDLGCGGCVCKMLAYAFTRLENQTT